MILEDFEFLLLSNNPVLLQIDIIMGGKSLTRHAPYHYLVDIYFSE